jgi:Ca2+-binding EF-hand superfamily protein
MIIQIRHKNDTSDDLGTFMGKVKSLDANSMLNDFDTSRRQKIEVESKQFKILLSLISGKIYERFKTILDAFRYFDSSHNLSLSLNEFA